MPKQQSDEQVGWERNENGSAGMQLVDYLMVIARRKWVILVTVLFTAVFAGIWISQIAPTYTARCALRVVTPPTGSADYVEYNMEHSRIVIGTYVEIANSSALLNELGRYVSPLPVVKAEAVTNTELMQISAESDDPALAQFAANKMAELVIAQSQASVTGAAGQVTVYVVDPAVIPQVPSSTNRWALFALALFVGVLGGLGLAFLFDNLDTRLYLIGQIEALTGLSVIGNIPDGGQPRLLFSKTLHVEAFRRLRTNLFTLIRDEGLKTLLVTSAVPKDGKSTIVANLAVSIAQANRRVIVVDAKLRETSSPPLNEFFEMHNQVGLSDVLLQRVSLSDVIERTRIPGLTVVTSGSMPPNPVELLGSQRMVEVLEELARQCDIVLLDSPASVSVTDPAVLAPMVDGVLLAVRHGWVRREALQATCQHLRNVNAKIVGIVADRTDLGTRSRFSRQWYPAADGRAR
jgi:capsular exopolysaccharide synthesis family protein